MKVRSTEGAGKYEFAGRDNSTKRRREMVSQYFELASRRFADNYWFSFAFLFGNDHICFIGRCTEEEIASLHATQEV